MKVFVFEEDIKIVDYATEADEENFAYAICECIPLDKGIEIPRQDKTTFIQFKCPKCGKELGMLVIGKGLRRWQYEF